MFENNDVAFTKARAAAAGSVGCSVRCEPSKPSLASRRNLKYTETPKIETPKDTPYCVVPV